MSGFVPVPIELLDAFGVGVYLFFGVIHLDLWIRRRDRRSHLWLAGAAAGALAVDLSGMVIRHSGASVPLVMVNLTGVAAATASIVLLVGSIARREWPRWLLFAMAGAVALAPLGAVVPVFGPLLFLVCFVLLAAAAMRAAGAGRVGDRESRATAAGVLVLIASLLIDLAMELTLLPKVSGLPILGFTFLFLVTARALSGRYDREHQELVALRRELEARVRERTEALVEANRQLAEASRTDALTGLANRRGFLESCAQEIVRAARSGEPWAVLMADLDHFKEVNDRHGHAAGDAVLCQAGAVIRQSLRAQDLVARWGGEEFILFLPQTAAEGAQRAAETVRAAIAAHPFEHDGAPIPLTVSLGVAAHTGEEPLETVIAAADARLYRAKQEGRNRVE